MSSVHVLDRYYLAITALITVAWQLAGFFVAWTFQFDKITDFTGALLTLLLGNTYHARNIVASVLIMIWAARTAGFLLYRVLKIGSDSRFDTIRAHFFKFGRYPCPSSCLIHPAVSDLALGGSNPTFGTARDVVGIVLWALGLAIETVSDAQKLHYKLNKPPKHKPFTGGLWKWSRHPPYFGEILCWWGIWTLTISPSTNRTLPSSAKAAQYGAVVSPLFTMLVLLFFSGIPTAEKPQAQRVYLSGDANAWEAYRAYLDDTSILIPIPPALYRPLPKVVKRTILFDFPLYQFDESEAADDATTTRTES
ncbi:hypothetical protein DFH94DRAFT_761879 [Russula ochroleuca]|uniref:Steroid 5-alpha reductase C-terminal domain-containing protein n=1 Tax=Russula ochroleuca TaxID=152965 RepID=A0A9P5JZV6_9AGAM|nr:hypothetical protein DFH94DRAFT_761879 [Russula ochroleuca]